MSVVKDSVTRFAADVVEMEYRGRVFGRRIQTADVRVDDQGALRVWDEVAGHWTRCHSITERGQRAIRRAAKAEPPTTGPRVVRGPQ